MTLYYDPFNAEEEDDFLESEQKRGCLEIEGFITRIINFDATLTKQQFDFEMSKVQLRRILDALQKEGINYLTSLKFSHWGLLPSDEEGFHQLLITVLILSNRIERLSLTSCGITGSGIQMIWEFLTINKSLKSLNLSRNMLGGILHQQNLNNALQTLTSRLSYLQELNLSAAGLTTESVTSLLIGLQENSSLQTLDISNNIDSLEKVLECLLDHLPRLKALRRLILTRGASSSTCIDSQNKNSLYLLRRLAEDSIQHNTSLYSFGPLYILSIDRQANDTTHEAYRGCVECLGKIQYYLKRNQLKPIIASIIASDSEPALSPSSLLNVALVTERENPAVVQYILRETVGTWSNK
jgi:hypothetical protein